MKFKQILLLIIAISIVLLSCKKEDEKTPQEMLEGKWTIHSSEILGSTVPGDGSYLQFNASFDGVDYKASDTTYGTFTYSMNETATIINITDTISDGGNWNFAWDVLDLTEAKLRMTTTTFLGNLTVEFNK